VDLSPWAGAEVLGRLGGGNRNVVVELRRGRERLVARTSRRTAAALDWELDLLAFLTGQGFRVPEVVPADDGQRQVDGVVVQRWLPGREPTGRDWPGVADELARLHSLTTDWPQRPGFRSTRELLTEDRGGDVDLSVLPPVAVARCRAAWQGLTGDHAVVHGDPGAPNVRITGEGVGLLDWDEARVDHPDLDFADLPGVALPSPRAGAARAAVDAWEAAAGWELEPEYARGRLAALEDFLTLRVESDTARSTRRYD
jgi:Ser/Thr protein kinase RdoA (MazF antagonist)